MSNYVENLRESFKSKFRSLYLAVDFKNMKEASSTMNISATAMLNSINYGIIPNPPTLLLY